MQISPSRDQVARSMPAFASSVLAQDNGDPSAFLTIRLVGHPSGMLLTVGGEIDAHTVDRLEDAFSLACASRPDVLIVDLGRVDFLGAAGLGAIVSCQRTLLETGGRLVLRGLSARLRRTIGYAGLSDHLEVQDLEVQR